VFLCSLSNFDAYTVTRAYNKAPKPFVFAIKSTDNLTFFENKADYLHMFSCQARDGHKWIEKILVARVSPVSVASERLIDGIMYHSHTCCIRNDTSCLVLGQTLMVGVVGQGTHPPVPLRVLAYAKSGPCNPLLTFLPPTFSNPVLFYPKHKYTPRPTIKHVLFILYLSLLDSLSFTAIFIAHRPYLN